MDKREIEIIKNAGIVGAGGAGFPSHVKFSAQAGTLIVNGAECEPMIDVDKLLLQHDFGKIYEGMKTAADLTGAKRIVLALKAKYGDAIKVIEDFKNSVGPDGFNFEIFKLGNFYPAGDEQVLAYEVTGKIVPEGGIPLQAGVIVTNAETLLNISNALDGKNVTQKYVTVNGEVANPMTLKVPVGTPVKKLIGYCGGVTTDGEYAVIDGGPMMGKIIDADKYTVKKTTKSIIVLPEDSIVVEHKRRSIHKSVKRAQAICLSCRMCTDLCPRYLLGHELFPDEMMKKMYRGELVTEDLERFDFAFLCCDCGLCELYSCVVDLSARSLFNYIKAELVKKGIKNPHTRKDLTVNDFRDYRKVPIDRLEKRLEVDKYHGIAQLCDFNAKISEIRLDLSQHVGVPSVPVVRTGEKVFEGQLAADICEGQLGAKIHSSINGTVSEITDSYITIKE